MNRTMNKCLPIFVLALGLSACGKSNDNKNVGPATAAAPSIATAFEADCGSDAALAAVDSRFDLGSCQLNQQQMALLQEVGPFKVDADCAHRTVRIAKKDADDQILGQGDLKEDGTFEVKLNVGPRFNELEGCPVQLEGLATGTVACDTENRVASVNVNTAFSFAPLADAAPLASLELQNGAQEPGKGKQEEPKTEPGKGKQEQPKTEPGKGNQEKPKTEPGKGTQEQPKTEPGKGKQEQPKTEPGKGTQEPPKTEPGKGKQEEPKTEPGKGNQEQPKTEPGKGQQGGWSHPPVQHVEGCVSFAPCAFNTSASMSCSR